MSYNDIEKIGGYEDTAKIKLYHPVSGEILEHDGQDFYVEVYGTHSKEYQSINRSDIDSVLAKVGKKGKSKLSSEEMEQRLFEKIAKCVKSWFIIVGGKTPEPTQENIKKVLSEYRWIFEQVEEGIYAKENFIKG